VTGEQMLQEQIRYSRNKQNNQINRVLFTIREGEHIFFGIARCNVSAGDNFDKKLGVKIAKARAEKAKKETITELETKKISETKEFYSAGRLPLTEIKDLLVYYHGLDSYHPLPNDDKENS
jgi:hypothetical protein